MPSPDVEVHKQLSPAAQAVLDRIAVDQLTQSNSSTTLITTSQSPVSSLQNRSLVKDLTPRELRGKFRTKIDERTWEELSKYIDQISKRQDPPPPPPPPMLESISGSWNFHLNNDVPVGGWMNFVLYPTGNWNFTGHMHDTGFLSYDGAAVVVIASRKGSPAFSLTAQGHMAGTSEFGGSRDWDWNVSGTNPAIVDAWPKLSADGFTYTMTAGANADLGAMLDSASKAVGVASAVIALV